VAFMFPLWVVLAGNSGNFASADLFRHHPFCPSLGCSMPVCLVGAGSNLGDRAENLTAAARQLGSHPQVDMVTMSRFHRTSPVGGPGGQGDFLNAAMRVETTLAPPALLQLLLEVERTFGRRRTQRWGPRTIDLDILLYV